MTFHHSFELCISNVGFESEIEDFDEAFDAWVYSFPTLDSLRKALLTTNESTKSLLDATIHSGTEKLES